VFCKVDAPPDEELLDEELPDDELPDEELLDEELLDEDEEDRPPELEDEELLLDDTAPLLEVDEELDEELPAPELEELELPELLEELPELPEPLEDAHLAPTSIVAAAGEPKSASPLTLVSAKAKCLPLAAQVRGTVTVLAAKSPSFQVTVPLVAT
jgi:hypothetical protein